MAAKSAPWARNRLGGEGTQSRLLALGDPPRQPDSESEPAPTPGESDTPGPENGGNAVTGEDHHEDESAPLADTPRTPPQTPRSAPLVVRTPSLEIISGPSAPDPTSVPAPGVRRALRSTLSESTVHPGTHRQLALDELKTVIDAEKQISVPSLEISTHYSDSSRGGRHVLLCHWALERHDVVVPVEVDLATVKVFVHTDFVALQPVPLEGRSPPRRTDSMDSNETQVWDGEAPDTQTASPAMKRARTDDVDNVDSSDTSRVGSVVHF